MGKLMDRLQKQLQDPEHKQDAEECIEIYNWLKSMDPEGAVWSSKWQPLVDVRFKGYPSDDRTYKLNFIGKAVLKGIRSTTMNDNVVREFGEVAAYADTHGLGHYNGVIEQMKEDGIIPFYETRYREMYKGVAYEYGWSERIGKIIDAMVDEIGEFIMV